MTDNARLLHRGLLVEYASLAWMTIEGITALAAGFVSGSFALIAFGGDSFVELLSSYEVASFLRGMEKGEKDAHKQATSVERISAFLLVTLIPIIGLGAVYSYLTGGEPDASPLGIVVAVGAVAIMPLLWYEKRRIGRVTGCLPLTIDAVESATCFLMSVALLASLLINYVWKISWADYVATAIILVFVAKEASETIYEIRDRR